MRGWNCSESYGSLLQGSNGGTTHKGQIQIYPRAHSTRPSMLKLLHLRRFDEKHFCFVKAKGQLISKGLFAILNSSKKRRKKFDLTTVILQVDLFSSVFWKNLKTPKIHFEIN